MTSNSVRSECPLSFRLHNMCGRFYCSAIPMQGQELRKNSQFLLSIFRIALGQAPKTVVKCRRIVCGS